ncbi:MAG TPA: hypothetical protein VNP04_07480 [Alphaproteobacteria bacterium]|nr:hypothetical protein [Alphaproteobacteria bacterium]
MPLPPFTASGDLPPGVYRVTLREALEHFGRSSLQRRIVAQRLERIYRVAQATGHLARFVVFGSFVTSKVAPNDVDVFLVMEDTFDATHLTGEALLLFDHAAAQAYFGGSVFWLRRLAALGGEHSAIEDWQITRDGSRRGILEIVLEVL